MRDHELKSLLNLVDEPTEPPVEFVDSLWAELEATLAGDDVATATVGESRRALVYLMVAAVLVVVLGAAALLVVNSSGSGSVVASPETLTAAVPNVTTSTAHPTCDLFEADGQLSVVWRTGVISGSTGTGYQVESDASAAQLSGSAEVVDRMAERVASGDGPGRYIAGQLERVSVNLGRASLLMQFDERVLAQEAIERARAELVGLAFEPGLGECIDPATWTG